MGTSSVIVFQDRQGKIFLTYINYDGYPEGVGAVLVNSVNTYDLVKSIATKYDYMSSIDEGPKISNGERRGCYDYKTMEEYLEKSPENDWQSDYTYTFCNDTETWKCESYGKFTIDLYNLNDLE